MSLMDALADLAGLAHDPATEWMGSALCPEIDPDLWFPRVPTERVSTPGPQELLAKAICRGCDVRVRCLQWAIEHDEEGIWGGTTKVERDQLLAEAA
ncbi:hypothetical protein GCM10009555_017140 [Acrocarpospora macrocephala]|uniref:Transcriptional regulator WhiB n=1 Tax=Acrocarpospora macrocephala TaxID=150177 RepID=A0A5M3WEI0_9ACTN|nr:WhiB family transcriptional regulator [Acrocarpospora macrocephala]GES07374.1 hypothetical protein Amac_009690 [Acrocarpospora macrocephala]